MSRAVDLFCPTCNATCDLDINHGDATVAALIGCRSEFASLRLALDREDKNQLWPIIDHLDSRFASVMRFMLDHVGHELTWRDEYGDDGLRCCKAIDCECGHRTRCLRAKGHDGECRSKP